MTISATDILVPVCFKTPLLYLLTQKVAQKFGYVLGIKWLREPHKARLKKFYYTACILNYLLQTVNPTSPFKTWLIAVLDEHKDVVSLPAMGFPKGWKDEEMWKI